MRWLSSLLLACVVLLSSFGGWVKPVMPEVKDCCKKMVKSSCHNKPVDKAASGNSCKQPGCGQMFTCSICGFVTERALTLQPLQAKLLPKPVARYISGSTAAYHQDNWKPPKAC